MGRRLEPGRAAVVTIFAMLLVGITTGPAAFASPDPADPGGEMVIDVDVELTMRDGVVLRADVARPIGPGVFPVIVTQTAYNKQAQPPRPFFVDNGYAHVVVDVRGTGSSGGVWSAYGADEQADGAEIVEWAAAQTWSTGKVGLWGASYSGQNQFLTARHQPDGLAAIFPIVSVGDAYRDLFWAGGQLNAEFLPPWMLAVGVAGTPGTAYWNDDPAEAAGVALSHYLGDALTAARIGLAAWTGGPLAHDGAFWRSRSPLAMVEDIDVPTYVVAGLDDIFQRGGPMLYEALDASGVDTKLLLGPWTHGETIAGEGLPADGVPFTLQELALRWFDQHLKGLDSELDAIPDVLIYERGTDRWQSASHWPDPAIRPWTLHLADERALTPTKPAAGTSRNLPQLGLAGLCSRSTWQFSAGLIDVPGCTDDPTVETALGLDWTTDPVPEAVHLQGPATADLFVSTTARDAFLTARLVDIAPDGTATELTAGWLSASHRAVDDQRSRIVDGINLQPWHPFTVEARQPVPPDQVMRLQIELQPVNVVIQPGHRLRLLVTPSDVPHAIPTLTQLVDQLGGIVSVHAGSAQASALHLPVVTGGDR